MRPSQTEEMRVLVLAPTGQDAKLIQEYLAQNGMNVFICPHAGSMADAMEEGAATLIIAEEALSQPAINEILDRLHRQPHWSDLPVLLISHHGTQSLLSLRALETFPNVVLLERPLRIPMLTSSVRATLRARQRQYEVRQHLHDLQDRERQLREAVEKRAELFAESQAATRQLESVLASISDGFMALDLEGRFISVNERAAENAGLDLSQMIGRKFSEVASPSFRDGWQEQAFQTMRAQKPAILERKDSRRGRWMEYRMYPSPGGLTVFEADVHERKMAEIRQRLLVELNDAIRPLREPHDLMWTVGSIVAKHFAVKQSYFCEWNRDTGLCAVDRHMLQGQPTTRLDALPQELPSTILEDLNSGLPVIIQDVASDPRVLEPAAEEAFWGRTFVAIPVLRNEKLAGALVLVDAHARTWTIDDVALLEQVAQRAVLGLETVQAQKALRLSEEQLELAVDGSSGGMFVARFAPDDPRWPLDEAYISPRAKSFLGFSDDEFPSLISAWHSRIHWADLLPLRRAIVDHFKGTTDFFQIEYRMRHKDGSWRWLQSRHRMLRDDQGRPLRWAGIDWDVTDRKHGEEHQARLAALVDASLEAITGQSLDGILSSWNPAAQKMYGYSTSEMVGESILRIVPDERRAELMDILARLRAGQQIRDLETVRIAKDGRRLPVSLTLFPVMDIHGKTISIATIERDITERKRWEARLHRATEEARQRATEVEQSHLIMEALLENIPEGIVIAAGPPDYLIRSESAYSVRLAGGTPSVGKPLSHFMLSRHLRSEDGEMPHPHELPLARALTFGELVVNEEWQLASPSDGTLSLLCNAGPIRDANGRVTGGVLTFRDITDRKRAEVQLRELNESLELRVRDRTRALLRHREQLRIMASELATAEQRERRRLATDLHDYLAQLLVVCRMKLSTAEAALVEGPTRATLEEMDDLLDQSLTYTRTLVSRLSPTILYDAGLLAAVRWLSDQFQREGLKVEVHGIDIKMPDDTAILLFQSVRELLYNVIKHAATTTAEVLVDCSGNEVLVEVSDRGKGFDPATALQGPSPDGQFGLFNVRERIEAAGGSFELDSIPNRGTRLALRVPNASQQQNPAFIPPPPETAPARNAAPAGDAVRVMLVDDHSIVRDGLRRVIEASLEFRVVGEAANGEEAVQYVHAIDPEVIVMDINMPRMNGIEATRIIKEMLPDITIVGLSLEDSTEIREAMHRAGAATLVSKNGPSGAFYEVLKAHAPARHAH